MRCYYRNNIGYSIIGELGGYNNRIIYSSFNVNIIIAIIIKIIIIIIIIMIITLIFVIAIIIIITIIINVSFYYNI